MINASLVARALQVAERIDLKGLERPDQFSSQPLAFKIVRERKNRMWLSKFAQCF